MAAEFICDGCGKRESAVYYPSGTAGWQKPAAWYQRQDDSGVQDACSRTCVQAIAQKTGKTSVVIPF
jgi:hypothetical protein